MQNNNSRIKGPNNFLCAYANCNNTRRAPTLGCGTCSRVYHHFCATADNCSIERRDEDHEIRSVSCGGCLEKTKLETHEGPSGSESDGLLRKIDDLLKKNFGEVGRRLDAKSTDLEARLSAIDSRMTALTALSARLQNFDERLSAVEKQMAAVASCAVRLDNSMIKMGLVEQ